MLTPEQLRDVHDMASHTIAESELPRVVRERDALLAACKEAFRYGRHPEGCSWWDEVYPNSLIHRIGVCDCHLSRVSAAIALCEQPQPEPQPCPTPPTDHRPKS